MNKLDRVKGCFLAGAIGDALGYAIEFDNEEYIFKTYGKNGIKEYERFHGLARISDDTQMSLFTAQGLLMGGLTNEEHVENIRRCYDDWLHTQLPNKHKKTVGYCKLYDIKELHSSRAPGSTCLNALIEGGHGTIEHPINQSKGCGGIMRVAPIALYIEDIKDADLLAAKVSAITHGHELGYMSSSMLVHIIHRLLSDYELEEAIEDSITAMKDMFKNTVFLQDMLDLVSKAILLSKEDRDDLEVIHELGEGWVAEETLAIAIYCSLKYKNDLIKAITVAVNHKGDSDSTGAVTGNIIGTYLGYESIPEKYLRDLELKDLIIEISQKLRKDA